MEDQFGDPEDSNSSDVSSALTIVKNDELERFLQMNADDIYKQLNPLSFSRDHQNQFPSSALFAHRLFSTPVASNGVERQFASARLTITERRSRLDPDTTNHILGARSA